MGVISANHWLEFLSDNGCENIAAETSGVAISLSPGLKPINMPAQPFGNGLAENSVTMLSFAQAQG